MIPNVGSSLPALGLTPDRVSTLPALRADADDPAR
jgi:hypothetical protein